MQYNAAVREFGANSQAAKAALKEAKAALAASQQSKAAAAAGAVKGGYHFMWLLHQFLPFAPSLPP